jgi:hypothetical protein
MPKEYYWDPEDVFVQSHNFNFTVKNYQKVYTILKCIDSKLI